MTYYSRIALVGLSLNAASALDVVQKPSASAEPYSHKGYLLSYSNDPVVLRKVKECLQQRWFLVPFEPKSAFRLLEADLHDGYIKQRAELNGADFGDPPFSVAAFNVSIKQYRDFEDGSFSSQAEVMNSTGRDSAGKSEGDHIQASGNTREAGLRARNALLCFRLW